MPCATSMPLPQIIIFTLQYSKDDIICSIHQNIDRSSIHRTVVDAKDFAVTLDGASS